MADDLEKNFVISGLQMGSEASSVLRSDNYH